MSLHISLNGSSDASVSLDLHELNDLLRKEGVVSAPVTMAVEGAKSALMTGLSIAGVTLNLVSTTLAVLSFWQSQKKKSYRVIVHSKGQDTPLTDLSADAVEKVAASDDAPQITIEKIQ